MNNVIYHTPVLLNKSIYGLVTDPHGVYVDATYGGGGHSKEVLYRLSKKGKLFAFDQDIDSKKNLISDTRLFFINSNFKHLKKYLNYYHIFKINGIIADFGVSSHQLDTPSRGFSIMKDGPLDMRMNKASDLTAEIVINDYEEKKLYKILKEYGQVPQASEIVNKISSHRKKVPIKSTIDLVKVVENSINKSSKYKVLAKIFQSIRIEVNDELEVIKQLLFQASELLKIKGRIICISYHSLEDRLIKNFFRSGSFDNDDNRDFYGNVKKPFKKIGGLIIPDLDEIKKNKRARSAKMRIAEKI
ncbi:MAG: 16S rRNA (cytosine(1402)-N(4))-methyltransferase RsmH [Bacteroidota bacterium]|nr:16S rRNA (cytosine(1402)-N(4))-methyltransferase RsmH [Bacteroidota bacterium]